MGDSTRRTGVFLCALVLAGCTGSAEPDAALPEDLAGARTAALPDAAPGEPIHVLAQGLARSMSEAAEALGEGRRAHAMKAADDAMRIGEVALFASSGAAQDAIARGVAAVHEARRRVQLGDPEAARRFLMEVADRLAAEARRFDSATPRARRPPWHRVRDDERYYGARLISARGTPLGEVIGFVKQGDDIGRLIVARGWRDFLGFWDVSGENVSVPGEWVVLGPAEGVGTTFIALAAEDL